MLGTSLTFAALGCLRGLCIKQLVYTVSLVGSLGAPGLCIILSTYVRISRRGFTDESGGRLDLLLFVDQAI